MHCYLPHASPETLAGAAEPCRHLPRGMMDLLGQHGSEQGQLEKVVNTVSAFCYKDQEAELLKLLQSYGF